jgi:uncharacterized membrane protein
MSWLRQSVWELAFLAAFFILGLCFLVVTPPFQVADENFHFLRAWHVVEGKWLGQRIGDQAGDDLPLGIARAFTPDFDRLRSKPQEKLTFEQFREQWHDSPALGGSEAMQKRTFVDFHGAVRYSPVAYAPQALGLAVARTLDMSVLGAMYIGRFANLLATVACFALALRLLGERCDAAWVMSVFMLLPIAVFQVSSLSADAQTFAMFALVFGLYLKMRRGFSWALFAAALVLSAVMALGKPVYGLACLIFAFAVPSPWKQRSYALLALLTVIVGLPALWSQLSADLFVETLVGNVDPRGQAMYIVGQPLRVVPLLVNTLLLTGSRLAIELVGNLGWLDTLLPSPLIQVSWLLAGVALVISTGAPGGTKPGSIPNLGAAAVLVLLLGAIFCALYLFWTPVGSGMVEGLQGRYFLPLYWLGWLSIPHLTVDDGVVRRLRWVTLAVQVLLAGWAIYVTFHRYWAV